MEPRRLTRGEQRSRTRSRLIGAAARVFARRGFEGASLSEIADEAGFTKGAVYSNFASKEDLLLTVLEEHLVHRLDDVRSAFAETGSLDDVRAGGTTLARIADVDADLWVLFVEFWTRASRDPRVRQRLAANYERWREAVGALVAARFERLGVPLPAPAEDVAAAAIALAEGRMLQHLVSPDTQDEERYGEMLAWLVAGAVVAGLGLDLDDLERLRSGARR